ncbi:hypothetical protein [Alicyclobacillus dauci]|uniref:Uncharacterized protein n=1 Tax=Alicyclobacillus dauci TaxID=1475485 RepID=A0ABY6Z7L2_9BACL|nr:hypothetical protein [Alicyclobacillus dauci]WAH38256.1 hypothetical protein NZD86_07175 [Alicyclobacillus dauci]
MTTSTVFGVIIIRIVMQGWERHIRRSIYPYEEAMQRVAAPHPTHHKQIRSNQSSRSHDAVKLA